MAAQPRPKTHVIDVCWHALHQLHCYSDAICVCCSYEARAQLRDSQIGREVCLLSICLCVCHTGQSTDDLANCGSDRTRARCKTSTGMNTSHTLDSCGYFSPQPQNCSRNSNSHSRSWRSRAARCTKKDSLEEAPLRANSAKSVKPTSWNRQSWSAHVPPTSHDLTRSKASPHARTPL